MYFQEEDSIVVGVSPIRVKKGMEQALRRTIGDLHVAQEGRIVAKQYYNPVHSGGVLRPKKNDLTMKK